MGEVRIHGSLIERLLGHVEVDGNGCWLWQGYVNAKGYGRMGGGTGRGLVLTHRAAYEQFVGPIPDGLEIDHVCHNRDASCLDGATCLHRRCVNPDHLEVVTHQENIRRGPLSHGNRTHCKQGHEFTPKNIYRTTRGTRGCRICIAAATRRWYQRRGRL